MKDLFVFKIKENILDSTDLDLDDEYIGKYISDPLSGKLSVEILSNTAKNYNNKVVFPLDKVEKLYTWK